MRCALSILVLGVSMIGCAAQHTDNPGNSAVQSEPLSPPVAQASDAAVAAALMFDPRVTMNEVGPDLSRERREPTAFVGFEDQSTTFFYIRIDDRQTGDDHERFERRAYIHKFGSTSR